MEPVVDHIEITVKDMSVAVPFYDKLLPLLGFDAQERVSAVMEEHDKHVVQYSHRRLGFAITSPRSGFASETINRRKPGALHHLAFKAPSRAEVRQAPFQTETNRSHCSEPAAGVPRIYPSRLLRFIFQGSGGY